MLSCRFSSLATVFITNQVTPWFQNLKVYHRIHEPASSPYPEPGISTPHLPPPISLTSI
jgi:hypothetical protein